MFVFNRLFSSNEFVVPLLQTRDVKLLPKSVRGELVIRRTMRKKINERIMAVTGTCFFVLVDGLLRKLILL